MTPVAFDRRCLVAVAASLLLAGCGDGDDDSKDRKVDRSGYFTKQQSEALNPSLAVYDEAFRESTSKHDACSKRSIRLFESGKDPRAAVKCHLDQTGAVIAALDDVEAAFGEIDASDFRAACTKQLGETSTFIDAYRDSWKVVYADWERYATGGAVTTAAVQQHIDAAYEQSDDFSARVVTDVAKVCYTKTDRAAAQPKSSDTETSKDEDADTDADA